MKKAKILWTITDGSHGMISQANGLAQNISESFIEKKISIKWPWAALQPGFLPINTKIFNNGFIEKQLPSTIITCGRRSIYASLYLKRKLKKKLVSIHIQNPKININNFDYLVVPNHDDMKGNNVITSVGALHHLTYDKINNAKKIFDYPKNKEIVVIIIGGENKHYNFDKNTINELLKKIKKLNNNENKYYYIFVPSRRTDDSIIKFIKDYFKDEYFIWDKKIENPYLFSLKIGNYFIVTSDSTSMISEAAYTGKPVFVYQLPFKRKSKRIENFHREFEKKGITRSFDEILYQWTYEPLNEAKRIAKMINERINNNEQ